MLTLLARPSLAAHAANAGLCQEDCLHRVALSAGPDVGTAVTIAALQAPCAGPNQTTHSRFSWANFIPP